MLMRTKLKSLEWRLAAMEKREAEDTVTCDTCGCLVAKHRAIKGKGEIRQRPCIIHSKYQVRVREDYIHYPYYCKHDAPPEHYIGKEDKKKKKEKKSHNAGRVHHDPTSI